MSIPVRCSCGQVYHADERHLGRKLRCRCGREVPIRRPKPTPRERLEAARAGWVGAAFNSPAARWTAALSWGYLFATVLAAVVLWGLGDRWWPATVLLFGPRWVLLLPLVVLVPAALIVRPRLLVSLLLAAGVVLAPIMGFRAGWRSWLGGEDPDLRVVTFNAQGEGGTALPFLLAEWSPDLVAFQECGHEVADVLPSIPGRFHHVQGGLCLLSRFPIRGTERLEEWDTGTLGGSGTLIRYTLETPRGPLRFVNVHLETPRKGLEPLWYGRGAERLGANTLLREVASGRAARWVAETPGPLVIAGDFNTPVESTLFQRDWGRWESAFEKAGTGFGGTRVLRWFRVRIDHVLPGEGWRAQRAWVGPDLGSDHLPLVADLRWTGEE